jgi:hypothetical protein
VDQSYTYFADTNITINASTSPECSPCAFTYTVALANASALPSFITQPANDIINVYANYTGTNETINITVTSDITTAGYTGQGVSYFLLNLFDPCSFDNQTVTVTPSSIATQSYSVAATNLTLTTTSVVLAPYPYCSYETVITGLDATFMYFDSATGSLTIYTTDTAKVANYTLSWRT